MIVDMQLNHHNPIFFNTALLKMQKRLNASQLRTASMIAHVKYQFLKVKFKNYKKSWNLNDQGYLILQSSTLTQHIKLQAIQFEGRKI